MTIASAVLVVTIPNILRAALFLALMFLGIAGLYVLANAELLAAFQVLIYVGAITVLIMFALVLTQQLMGAKLTQSSNVRLMALAAPVVGLVFAFLVKSFIKPFGMGAAMYDVAPKAADASTLQTIATMLLKPYVLPFELASFILLAALVGAIVIAKEDRE
jgi:NADH-quinone oxidoreductase subunit J